jgi:hypothetical protein
MSTPTRQTARRNARFRFVRASLGGGYVLAIVLCLDHEDAPRWFWTVAMPLLPLVVVAAGFHTWRNLCPLAALGSLGARFAGRRQRVPRWLDQWALSVAFVLLLAGLVLRHVALNGDHTWLGCSLTALALGAILCNLVFSGKTWCNVLCPVGVVERIYTDGGSLRTGPRSACERCTGCKAKCPDIDPARSYRADLEHSARCLATYGLPGLVFAFYAYYRLRHGRWSAFFDGGWTRRSCDDGLAFGPGFTFAPEIPAIVAATVTLTLGAAASFALFTGVEHVLRRRGSDPALVRHRVLTMASFVAFNCFYLFAGQPTLRRFPFIDRVVAFIVPVLSTLVLARRWSSNPRERRSARALPVVPTPRKVVDSHVPPDSPPRARG